MSEIDREFEDFDFSGFDLCQSQVDQDSQQDENDTGDKNEMKLDFDLDEVDNSELV